MIAYARFEISVLIGEVGATRFRVRVEKPQRIRGFRKPSAAQRPLRYIEMYTFGRHIIKVLRLIGSTFKLTRRKNHVADRIVPAVLALHLLHSVHDDRSDGTHARIALATRFALNNSR